MILNLVHLTCVTEVVGSIPAWDFSVVLSPVAKQLSHHHSHRHITPLSSLIIIIILSRLKHIYIVEPADQWDTLYKNLEKQPSSPGVPVAQWLEHPTGVMEVVGSIPSFLSVVLWPIANQQLLTITSQNLVQVA